MFSYIRHYVRTNIIQHQDEKALEAAKNAIVENEEIMATETAKLHKLEADLVREQENLEKVMESLKGTLH